jgi:hypothetical protein
MSNVLLTRISEGTASNCETGNERRTRERLKICLPVHIRSIGPSQQQIEEAATTLDLNRHGLCFTTSRDRYHVGMRLLLTFPYSSSTLDRKEFVGEVVRVDQLPSSGRAVAVQFHA